MELIDVYREHLPQDRVRLCAEVRYDSIVNSSQTDLFYFEFPAEVQDDIVETGDPWLLLFLPVSMVFHETLKVSQPVDDILLEHCREMLDIWHCWMPDKPVIEIEAKTRTQSIETRGRTASFFSAGVDSMYALCHHHDAPDAPRAERIEDLISIMGIFGGEQDLVEGGRGTPLLERARGIAQRYDANLIEMSSNAWDTRFGFTRSSEHSHGCLLAASAIALGRRFARVLIPGSRTYMDAYLGGHHPLTDLFLSSSATRFISDGWDRSRQQKIAYLASHQHSFASLQVCSRDPDLKNCGECYKCLKSMLFFAVQGKLQECELFPEPRLDFDKVIRMYCSTNDSLHEFNYVQDSARRQGQSDIVDAIDAMFQYSAWLDSGRRTIRRLRQMKSLTATDREKIAEFLGLADNPHIGVRVKKSMIATLNQFPRLHSQLSDILEDSSSSNQVEDIDAYRLLERALLCDSYRDSGLDMELRNPIQDPSLPSLVFVKGQPLVVGKQNLDDLILD